MRFLGFRVIYYRAHCSGHLQHTMALSLIHFSDLEGI